jgi:hypothetical protein
LAQIRRYTAGYVNQTSLANKSVEKGTNPRNREQGVVYSFLERQDHHSVAGRTPYQLLGWQGFPENNQDQPPVAASTYSLYSSDNLLLWPRTMASGTLKQWLTGLLTLQTVLGNPVSTTPPCPPGAPSPPPLGVGKVGAVASESEICSHIGIDLLKLGGNAADAMVGTVACIGVVGMYHSGKLYIMHSRRRSCSKFNTDREQASVVSELGYMECR